MLAGKPPRPLRLPAIRCLDGATAALSVIKLLTPVTPVAQESNVIADELDRGIDLVGDTGGQPAHRFHNLDLMRRTMALTDAATALRVAKQKLKKHSLSQQPVF